MKQSYLEQYLYKRFGKERGRQIYRMKQKRLEKLINEIKTQSKTQQKTLKTRILPIIALYQVLQKKMIKEQAYDIVNDYMQMSARKKGIPQYQKMEKIPGFFFLFSKAFSHICMNSDNWKAEKVISRPDAIQINIHKCLWYDTCAEYGCPELTKVFCACDDTLYGSMHKMAFTRTGSIGRGNEVCDFLFEKAK